MLAIGYVRVSTERQAGEGVSLAAQEAKVRAMAVVRGIELAEVIVDAESGKSLKRAGAKRLLEMVGRGEVATVIIAKLDRLTRSVRDLCRLLDLFEKKNVALVSVAESLDTSSAAGRLVITIMGAVNQWERESIGERTRDALRHKRSNSERVGNIHFGYRLAGDGKHVEPDPAEQATLTEMQTLRQHGGTLRSIAAHLNSNGHRTRRGSAWRHTYIASMLATQAIAK